MSRAFQQFKKGVIIGQTYFGWRTMDQTPSCFKPVELSLCLSSWASARVSSTNPALNSPTAKLWIAVYHSFGACHVSDGSARNEIVNGNVMRAWKRASG